MSTTKRFGAPLAIVLALLACLLLAPSGGTQARWSDVEASSPGAVSSDGISLTASTGTDRLRLPATATVKVRNTSDRLAGLLSVTTTVAPVGQSTGLANQLAVSYAECASGAAVGSSPLSAGGMRDLCVTATPQHSGADLLRRHAGAAVTVTSDLTQTAVVAPAWTASASVTSQFAVDFPRPTQPGPTLRLTDVCSAPLLLGQATISWAWPDTSGRQSATTPAVSSWAIQQKESNGWVDIVSVGGNARSATMPGGKLLGVAGTKVVRVVGYSAANPGTPPVVGTFEVKVSKTLDLLGLSVLVSCTEAVHVG